MAVLWTTFVHIQKVSHWNQNFEDDCHTLCSQKMFNRTDLSIFSHSFDYALFLELQFNQYKLLLFLWFIIIQLLLFCFSVIILASMVVDLFVCIHRIKVHWYWSLSSVVLEHCLWGVLKPDNWILFPCRFLEGCGEGTGWVFRLVCFKWFLCLI